MGACKCGCGEEAKAGRNFLPGHDMKLRKQLEEKVGGLFNLEKLVNAAKKYSHGKMAPKDFTEYVEDILKRKQ